MQIRTCVFLFYFCIYCVNSEDSDVRTIQKVFIECGESNESFSCLSEKAALAIERSMEKDVDIIGGIKLSRNQENIQYRQSKSLKGFDRFTAAALNFFKTHSFTVDSSEARKRNDDFGFPGGYGTSSKKEKKYAHYALMVLLGITSLTAPLMLKIMGFIAAKALIASKAALILAGTVALKKIFSKEHHSPVVKVHTVKSHDEEYDHDKISNTEGDYFAGPHYSSPYYAGYQEYVYNSPYKMTQESIKVTAR